MSLNSLITTLPPDIILCGSHTCFYYYFSLLNNEENIVNDLMRRAIDYGQIKYVDSLLKLWVEQVIPYHNRDTYISAWLLQAMKSKKINIYRQIMFVYHNFNPFTLPLFFVEGFKFIVARNYYDMIDCVFVLHQFYEKVIFLVIIKYGTTNMLRDKPFTDYLATCFYAAIYYKKCKFIFFFFQRYSKELQNYELWNKIHNLLIVNEDYGFLYWLHKHHILYYYDLGMLIALSINNLQLVDYLYYLSINNGNNVRWHPRSYQEASNNLNLLALHYLWTHHCLVQEINTQEILDENIYLANYNDLLVVFSWLQNHHFTIDKQLLKEHLLL